MVLRARCVLHSLDIGTITNSLTAPMLSTLQWPVYDHKSIPFIQADSERGLLVDHVFSPEGPSSGQNPMDGHGNLYPVDKYYTCKCTVCRSAECPNLAR